MTKKCVWQNVDIALSGRHYFYKVSQNKISKLNEEIFFKKSISKKKKNQLAFRQTIHEAPMLEVENIKLSSRGWSEVEARKGPNYMFSFLDAFI